MTGEGPWAHSKNEEGERHGLVEHLTCVAAMARGFAEPFGGGELAYWAGLWHDLGKFHPEFQDYLLACEREPGRRQRGPDHKHAGSTVALGAGGPLALLVAGHHGGLHNWSTLNADIGLWCKETRVAEALALAGDVPREPSAPLRPPAWADGDPYRAELFLRMLFSCLVDADFLDTERHFQPGRSAGRQGVPELAELWPVFEQEMAGKTGRGDDRVSLLRDEVYQACVAAGELPSGLFRLTVPTGGGKTLAGMAFALRHALAHGMRRVIVAVPYTSITEQNAAVYRGIFGEAAVLEHHSAVPPGPDPDETDGGPQWQRLAAENWDAPVIVTTTVRLFEALFARKPSDCRRLHRVAGSVLILDEAQTLPSRLLDPILDVLKELAAHYGVSVVFCTATQPALDDAPGFTGLAGVREIAPEPPRLFTALTRVRYEWPREGERWTWERAATEMGTLPWALAVVNTKNDARALLEAAPPGTLHLSTSLCGAHRRDLLAEIRRRLKDGEPCRVVSTQVVEAGVDLDFPLVLRAMGPLDRIVQAAGRCNREGKLAAGRVVVFEPAEGGLPPGDYKTGAELTAMLLNGAEVDPNDPATFTRYFRRLYGSVALDAAKVQPARAALDYPETAARFRMIDDDGEPVLVHYHRDDDDPRVDEVVAAAQRSRGVTRELRRAAQPFTVSIRRHEFERAQRELLVEELTPGLWLWRGGYDAVRGLTWDKAPDILIV